MSLDNIVLSFCCGTFAAETQALQLLMSVVVCAPVSSVATTTATTGIIGSTSTCGPPTSLGLGGIAATTRATTVGKTWFVFLCVGVSRPLLVVV